MEPLLLALAIVRATCEGSEALTLQLEISPTELGLGDVLFVRVSVENGGKEPIAAPQSCLLENGTLALRLYDSEESTSYHFRPDGGPMGTGLQEAPLGPGARRVVSLLMLRVPRLDHINLRFWNPQQ
jgi:hypothetical protein